MKTARSRCGSLAATTAIIIIIVVNDSELNENAEMMLALVGRSSFLIWMILREVMVVFE